MKAGRAAIDTSLPCCAACAFFRADPRELEARISGMRSFGSGFASVRAGDGLCERHDRYLSASAHCPAFEQRLSPAANAR